MILPLFQYSCGILLSADQVEPFPVYCDMRDGGTYNVITRKHVNLKHLLKAQTFRKIVEPGFSMLDEANPGLAKLFISV